MHHYKRGLADGPLRSFLATMPGSSNGEEIARGGGEGAEGRWNMRCHTSSLPEGMMLAHVLPHASYPDKS